MVEYIAPSSLEAAVHLMCDGTQPAMVLAGGTQILVDMRAGLLQPAALIDLRYLETMQDIRLENHQLVIGARSTFAQIERHPLVLRHIPLLTEMTRSFAHPLVRASATLGGNIASLHPTADAIVPLLALDATLHLQGPGDKRRRQSIQSFIAERRQEPMPLRDLITSVTVPVPPLQARWFYYKLGKRKAGSASVATLATLITMRDRHIQEAHIAVGAITATPLRAAQIETILLNEQLPLRDQTIAHCLSVLAQELQEPLDDLWAGATYRIMMGQALLKKALQHLNTQYKETASE